MFGRCSTLLTSANNNTAQRRCRAGGREEALAQQLGTARGDSMPTRSGEEMVFLCAWPAVS